MSTTPAAAGTAPAKPAKKKHDGKHMTPRQIREAMELFEQGAATIEELSKKYGKHRDTIARLFKRVGAEFGSKKSKVLDAVAEKAKAELDAEAEETRKRIKETRDQSYKMLDGIAKLTTFTLQKARENNAPLGSVEKDLKSLKLAAETVEITRRGRFNILGLDRENTNEDELPALEIIEKTDAEIRAAAEAQLRGMRDADELDASVDALGEGLDEEELEEALEDQEASAAPPS